MRHVILFFVCFVIGSTVALIGRTALHKPYAASVPVSVATPETPVLAQSSMVVNTICPICGMDVDPHIAVQEWQGHRIGLGCAKCPEKFAVQADYYGPYALKNEKAPKP